MVNQYKTNINAQESINGGISPYYALIIGDHWMADFKNPQFPVIPGQDPNLDALLKKIEMEADDPLISNGSRNHNAILEHIMRLYETFRAYARNYLRQNPRRL